MDNKPAFQDKSYDEERKSLFCETELSIRDYFAAKALQGLLADPNGKGSFKEYASDAYAMADAMLEARK